MSQPFSFVQITDIHIGAKTPAEWLAEDLRQIEAEVGSRVDFIAATGDLTDTGTEEECRGYVEALKATRLKVHPVVGNHDYVNGTWKEGKYDAGSYQKHISPLNYSFDHKGVHFVSYDSIQKGNEAVPSEWLLADLEAQPHERPIVVLVHYPLTAKFYDALKRYPIVATLSGHWHTSRLYHDGKIAHFNSPSLCFGGIDYSPRGYRVFRWDGQTLHCQTVPLKRPQPQQKSPASISVGWSAPLDAESHIAAPLLVNGRVIAGLMNENEMNRGALACWDAESGKQLWRVPLKASVKNTPASHQDLAIAATVTGEVTAVNVADGQTRWTYQLGDPSERWIFSAPVVKDGKVYVGSAPHFAALNADTGKPIWVREGLNGSDWISSYVSPVCDGERVYMGFFWGRTNLIALNAASGETLWQLLHKDGDTSSTPVLDGKGALYAMRSEFVQKIDTATGNILWKFKVGEVWNPATPLVEDGVVYAASGAGKVFALDAETGVERWSWECGDDIASMLAYRRGSKTIVSSPRRAGSNIVIGCNDGRLVGLAAKDGVLQWAHDFGVPVTATPVIDRHRIFLPSRDGQLYALRVP